MRALLSSEPYFGQEANRLGVDVANIPLTPPAVRLKLWSLMIKVYRMVADEHGARFLDLPPSCQDAAGFLRREFWNQDVTHANSEYGMLLLDHIVRRGSEAPASAEITQ